MRRRSPFSPAFTVPSAHVTVFPATVAPAAAVTVTPAGNVSTSAVLRVAAVLRLPNRRVYSTASPNRAGSTSSTTPIMSAAAALTAALVAARARSPAPSWARATAWMIVPSGSPEAASVTNTACTVRLAPAGSASRSQTMSRPTPHPLGKLPLSDAGRQAAAPVGICKRTCTSAASVALRLVTVTPYVTVSLGPTGSGRATTSSPSGVLPSTLVSALARAAVVPLATTARVSRTRGSTDPRPMTLTVSRRSPFSPAFTVPSVHVTVLPTTVAPVATVTVTPAGSVTASVVSSVAAVLRLPNRSVYSTASPLRAGLASSAMPSISGAAAWTRTSAADCT